MNSRQFCLIVPALMLATFSFAQSKSNSEEEQEKTNSHNIRINGFADTFIAPSFIKMLATKQYNPNDIDGDPVITLQTEIKDILLKEGLDASKFMVISMYNNPGVAGKKSSVAVSCFTIKVYDLGRAENLPAKLSQKGYSITQFASDLDDNLVNFSEIDKALLPRAIQNGKAKATETAMQLGIKNYSLHKFVEGGLKNKNTTSRDGNSITIEKVRLQKNVTLIYKID